MTNTNESAKSKEEIQREIEEATRRWDETSRHKGRNNDGGAVAFLVLVIVAAVILFLFMPADFLSEQHMEKTKDWGEEKMKWAKYVVPCMAPESSIVGKWVRGRGVDCATL